MSGVKNSRSTPIKKYSVFQNGGCKSGTNMNTVRTLNLKVNVNLYTATQPSKYEPSMYGSYFNPKAWIVVHYFTVSTESLVVMT